MQQELPSQSCLVETTAPASAARAHTCLAAVFGSITEDPNLQIAAAAGEQQGCFPQGCFVCGQVVQSTGHHQAGCSVPHLRHLRLCVTTTQHHSHQQQQQPPRPSGAVARLPPLLTAQPYAPPCEVGLLVPSVRASHALLALPACLHLLRCRVPLPASLPCPPACCVQPCSLPCATSFASRPASCCHPSWSGPTGG